MNKYKIFSDSSCDLEPDILPREYQIPFVISFDGENYYKEKEEISVDEFYQKIEGKYPKTSVPSVQSYIDKFTPVLESGEDIICITISGELSSSIQSAKTAGQILSGEFPERKIYIEDSRVATVTQALLIKEMMKMQSFGKNIDEVLSYLQETKNDRGVIFTVGDVSYLQKGGRIGSIVLKSAKALNLKAVVYLEDGKVASLGVVRGEKSGCNKISERVAEQFSNHSDYVFATGFTNSQEMTNVLEENIKEKFSDIQYEKRVKIGATIGAHTGNGTFGIAYIKRFDV